MTVVWRQTAYRMRHCFARRIDETGDRRKLVCTSNKIGRAAADDRSKSNRLATPNAATPRAGIPIPEAQRPFEPETANLKPFSRGIKRGILSFVKESIPLYPRPHTVWGIRSSTLCCNFIPIKEFYRYQAHVRHLL